MVNPSTRISPVHAAPANAQVAAFKTDDAVIHIAVANHQAVSKFFGCIEVYPNGPELLQSN